MRTNRRDECGIEGRGMRRFDVGSANDTSPARVATGHGADPAVILRLQRTAGNVGVRRALAGEGGVVVQRALAAASGKAWGWSDRTVFSAAETLSKVEGKESDTGSFTHAGESKLLDPEKPQALKWDGAAFGTLRPFGQVVGGMFVPGVKLHLVNSYLHPEANDWGDNWVWGHKQLNVEHTRPEGKAKTAKKKAVAAGGGLQYRTEVKTKGPLVQSGDEMAQEIAALVERNGKEHLPLESWPDQQAVLDHVQVGSEKLGDFQTKWSTAVQDTVATSLKVEWRPVNASLKAGATSDDDASFDDAAEVRPALNDGARDVLLAKGAITVSSRRGRKRGSDDDATGGASSTGAAKKKKGGV